VKRERKLKWEGKIRIFLFFVQERRESKESGVITDLPIVLPITTSFNHQSINYQLTNQLMIN
jgi:hypothetical protein